MGERKVLNKYIPSDFDPSLVPKHKNTAAGRKAANKKDAGKTQIRMMIPFSMQCENCGTFMYRGKKFNCYKEDVQGSKAKYLGIQRFRFYIKCIVCSRPVTFLTDPENNDYEMESGATRNYEIWKDKNKTVEDEKEGKEEEEEMDAMKALENRVEESRREVEEQDRLEEIKALNSRHVRMENVETSQERDEAREEAEIEKEVQSVVFGKKDVILKRLSDDDDDEDFTTSYKNTDPPKVASSATPKESGGLKGVVLKKKKKKRKGEGSDGAANKKAKGGGATATTTTKAGDSDSD
ncbi:hypothetical protein TrRE_jg5874 [Triparma retinervis]|uniref:Splicing factor YJU2 n=1 Tax=Triparma retinervis TaxID=2557542 RepID=A0A9W7AGX4_9STRA|nr:hypothetical protein TrRE_jg5874 [Triparma retinervis]